MDEDSSEETGWSVTTDILEHTIIHIQQSKELSEGRVDRISLPTEIVRAGDTLVFQYNAINYKLFATATAGSSDNLEDYMNVRNYKLFIQANIGSQNIKQLIFAAPHFDDGFPKILFIGDLDKDNRPDILLDAVWHYNEFAPTLYLSSFREKGELLKLVAVHSTVGC